MKNQIVYMGIEQVTPYERNPRKNQKAVKAVANSIKEFGFQSPIIVDKNYVVINGHTRLLAAKELGLEEVPVIIADKLTEDQVRAFRLADNKVAEIAEWDEDLLAEELQLISELDMTLFGFEEQETFDDNEVEEDDYEIPETLETRVKEKEIWKLGDHYLMCGDSTNWEDVEKLMQGNEADLLYTDPPYNVNVSNSEGMKIENDNMSREDFKTFIEKAFFCASKALKQGGAFYLWHAESVRVIFEEACELFGMVVKQNLIWNKNAFTFGRQDYKWKHEPCLYGWKEGAGHFFVPEFNHPTVITEEQDFSKMKKEELVKILTEIKENTKMSVVDENKPVKNDLHPTMKPIKMCGDMIHNSSQKGEIVLDLFGGSGSTLVACEQLNRRCYMMEYSEHYASVIVDRWEKLTGDKAIKIC